MANHLLTWGELTPTQRATAVKHRCNELLVAIAEGAITFNGPIGEGIAAAEQEALRLRTPWFFASIVQEKVGDLLMQLASSEAQEMLYRNPAASVWISDCVLEEE